MTISKEVKAKAYYDLAKPKPPVASSKRLVASNTAPHYTDDYLDWLLSPEEILDIQKQLPVSPMVRKNIRIKLGRRNNYSRRHPY